MTMRIVRRPRLSSIGKKCPPPAWLQAWLLTMGGGQLYCIGLTRRPLLGLSLLPHPKSSLALARTRVQWPFCSPLCLSIRTSIVPLCPVCRNDCQPLKAVMPGQKRSSAAQESGKGKNAEKGFLSSASNVLSSK